MDCTLRSISETLVDTPCASYCFMLKIQAIMQFSLNIQMIANVTLILNDSSTKKVILSEHCKCNLHFKNNIVKVVCYILQLINNSSNEIRNRTCVIHWQQRCFVSEGIYSFTRESVINNPFITTCSCLLPY